MLHCPPPLSFQVYASYGARFEGRIVQQLIKNDGGSGDYVERVPETGMLGGCPGTGAWGLHDGRGLQQGGALLWGLCGARAGDRHAVWVSALSSATVEGWAP